MLGNATRREEAPSAMACTVHTTQPARTVGGELQGETAEKSKSRAPRPRRPALLRSTYRSRMWGVLPQFPPRTSPERNSQVRARRPGRLREVTCPWGGDNQGGGGMVTRSITIEMATRVKVAGDRCQIRTNRRIRHDANQTFPRGHASPLRQAQRPVKGRAEHDASMKSPSGHLA